MNSTVRIIGVLVAVLGYSGCDSKSAARSVTPGVVAAQDSAKTASEPLALERGRISFLKTPSSMTAMAFHRTTSPPWESGNSWEFRVIHPALAGSLEEHAAWRVVNLHAENLTEIARRLGIDEIEVQILHRRQPAEYQETGRPARRIIADNGYALITDRRIPREWLVVEPKCEHEIGRQLRAQLPEAFRGAK